VPLGIIKQSKLVPYVAGHLQIAQLWIGKDIPSWNVGAGHGLTCERGCASLNVSGHDFRQ